MFLLWVVAFVGFSISVFTTVVVDLTLDGRVALLGNFLGFQRILNPGIAFGLSFFPTLQFILILAALIAVLWIASESARTPFQQCAFGLIVGGAMANIIDRISDGFVTDYFQVGLFPVFNMADSCITVGVLLLLFDAIVQKVQKS